MKFQRMVRFVMVWCLLLLPAAGWAQLATGTIAGVVKDTSGAVMPGVTVEAASPALIEKVRSVVTDGQGRYTIVDLRPGTYTVTFTLPGFGTFRREGLDLTAGFSATINAELKVGAVEESITVSAEVPVVDVQNIRQSTTVARDTLDGIPTTRRFGQYATFIPGAVYQNPTLQDAGTGGEAGQFGVHGQRPNELNQVLGGMVQNATSGGSYSFNAQTFQEVVVETSGTSAEAPNGGVQVNVVPKDGGNTFSGNANAIYTGPKLQSSNLTDELRARRLTSTPGVKKIYDNGVGLGGPFKRDRLWFFFATRFNGSQEYIPGSYYNKLQNQRLVPGAALSPVLYEPDLSRPAVTNEYFKDASLRLTWQAADRHKIVASGSFQGNCSCPFGLKGVGGTRTVVVPAPEALGQHHYDPIHLLMATWTYTATNRMLIEAGASMLPFAQHSTRMPGSDGIIGVNDSGTSRNYGARVGGNLTPTGGYTRRWNDQNKQRFAVSYITGSHSFKTGFDLAQTTQGRNPRVDPEAIPDARDYTFRFGVPSSVRIWATPHWARGTTRRTAIFAQDQWTRSKLTLNLGLRYDALYGFAPAYELPAGQFVPARSFPAVKNVPNWKNLNPRLGAAYDVFGNAKTALKMSLGRYVGIGGGVTSSPATNQAASATRNWNDSFYGVGDPRRGNYVPDCILDASVPGTNGECGPLSDQTFGQVTAGSTRYAKDALEGFNGQSYNWQGAVQVQHELREGMALNVGYFRTWYGGFTVIDNQAVTPADYDHYCITAPVDSRLPTSGQQLCGYYDIKPALFGKTDNLVTRASHYGNQTDIFNGVDVTLQTRFGQGGQFSGGLSLGRTVTDNCFVVDSPEQALAEFCHIQRPWSAGTQLKFLAIYPLPLDFRASVIYQNIPGIPISASYTATNAEIRTSLGRHLAACPSQTAATCTSTAAKGLIPISRDGTAVVGGVIFEDRLHQLDFRFGRLVQIGKVRIRGNLDIYNVFNVSDVLSMNSGYGTNWLDAVQVLGARLFKVSAQLDF